MCVLKGYHFEHLLKYNRLFSEPPTVYRGKCFMFRVISVTAV